MFTVSAIIGSAVLYHDFDDMSFDQMSRFMTGCAVEFLGVYLITSKRPKRMHPALSISADSSNTAIMLPEHEPFRDSSEPLRSTKYNRASLVLPTINPSSLDEPVYTHPTSHSGHSNQSNNKRRSSLRHPQETQSSLQQAISWPV
ncbi:hypothetical protein G6F68_014523 [Rhizopus microsporus]|nr:hypothetical protein G6F68_014523 [Rhizopus microsporus]